MKFALLGADAQSLPLLAAALAAGHEMAWAGDLSLAPDDDVVWPGGADQGDEWEDLLVAETADAIIVGRGAAADDLRTRQVQEFARLGRPMLTTFPLFPSVLTYFEIDMSRTEGNGVLHYYNPLRDSSSLAGVEQWVVAGHPRFGRVEQIVATRALSNRSRDNVLHHFACDVDLLAFVGGKLNRIGAHASTGAEADYSALSVQLLGATELPVRWGVEPPAEAEGLTLHFIGERGRESFWFDAAGLVAEPASAPARRAVDRFTAAIAAEAVDASWQQALRAMELTDSIEISLRRGRMIDVHDQQLTEQLAFKGTMAALGCGLLLLLVPGLLVAGWLGGAVGFPLAEYWPHLLLTILAIFLGLQFLPKLLYKSPPSDSK
ncbi:hypothetical protein [Lacipirellula sp.]|uniref:hypothetical protein n=1 Tax=Lacipirellula sp. TaxID=2691419 RepID=UPI003D0E34D3